MIAETAVRTDSEHMELLRRLIGARGIDRYGLYLLTSENRYTPTGFEEMSGYVIDPSGHGHFFWAGWDDSKHEEAFTVWQDAGPRPDWSDDEEYLGALADSRAGLPGDARETREVIEPAEASS